MCARHCDRSFTCVHEIGNSKNDDCDDDVLIPHVSKVVYVPETILSTPQISIE